METPGSYVGLVLSSELNATDRELFQEVLAQLVDLRVQVSVDKNVNYYVIGKKRGCGAAVFRVLFRVLTGEGEISKLVFKLFHLS